MAGALARSLVQQAGSGQLSSSSFCSTHTRLPAEMAQDVMRSPSGHVEPIAGMHARVGG